ncbi:hypothetical protein [Sphingomonas sp. ERG5]|uniref:hypothetical protein n=1 Tax=Sphingomonas sp. ERG5 TaxID=1381597 RepID=UPI00126A4DF4|nr:hypothetical protein [Sphingomonas sp. ERG5]
MLLFNNSILARKPLKSCRYFGPKIQLNSIGKITAGKQHETASGVEPAARLFRHRQAPITHLLFTCS